MTINIVSLTCTITGQVKTNCIGEMRRWSLIKRFDIQPANPSVPRLPIHENGWASTLDCMRFLRPKVSQYKGITEGVVARICSYSWLLGVTLCDDKHRFQLAGATDIYGILEEGSSVLSFGFIRARSGHSGVIAELVNRSAYSWIPPSFANSVSCICHKNTEAIYTRDLLQRPNAW